MNMEFLQLLLSLFFECLLEANLKACKCAIIFSKACNYCIYYCIDCSGLLVSLICVGQPIVFIKVRKYIFRTCVC